MDTASQAPARMPVLFVGHGSPMNAIQDNVWSRAFRDLGRTLPKPRAILAISAHWFVPGTRITGNDRPPTLHDFSGFPQSLYEVRYPAPGDPALVHRVMGMLGPGVVTMRVDWGLDHGTWSVLRHLFPDADCPVVQLGIDDTLAVPGHIQLGRELAPLRDEGVLLLCSGNLTHNLRDAFARMSRGDRAVPAWAKTFDDDVTTALEQRDGAWLATALESHTGRLCHPSPDHYLPLLYAAGAADARDSVDFPVTGFDMGSLSMRAVRFTNG